MGKTLLAVKSATIAGLYAALVILLAPISFYQFQARVADALLLLPFFDFFGSSAVLGLAIGCVIANLVSPFGVVDVVFGALANLLAGSIAWAVGRRGKGSLALTIAATIEALVVSAVVGYFVLHAFGGVELVVAFVGVLVGEAVSVCGLGIPLCIFIRRVLRVK
jgi:uncharacterized membrane protein